MDTQMTDTVTLTIDGREVTVPKGTTILQAAESLGLRIPHYCYHPGLSAPAQCRLCLVEVEGAPKLAASCVTQAMDGQVVRTESGPAREMRQGVLEFYLANHPLDCPICDQSGECKLQDYVHAEGRAHGRSKEPKRVFGRDDFGGDVLFYGDRCVMCTRCVRFMNEVAQDPRLTVVERGNRSIIDTFFEEGLSGSPWAGNIVDICPVGALVSKDFLHKARAWDLDHTPSVCPNCSQGCNIDLHVRDDLVQRLRPRENSEVNQHWMCDYGRHRYEWINAGPRIELPHVTTPEGLRPAEWDTVIGALSERLAGRTPGSVVALASPFASNEELAGVAALVELLGGGELLFRSPRAAEEIPLPGVEGVARRRDLAPNRTGAELLGFRRIGGDDGEGGIEDLQLEGRVLLVVGDRVADASSSFGEAADLVLFLGSHPSPLASRAYAVLPLPTFAEQEGTYTNHEGRVQRFWPGLREPGMARPGWEVLGRIVQALGGPEAPVSPEEAFGRAAGRVPAWSDMSYEALGTRGLPAREPAALPGG